MQEGHQRSGRAILLRLSHFKKPERYGTLACALASAPPHASCFPSSRRLSSLISSAVEDLPFSVIRWAPFLVRTDTFSRCSTFLEIGPLFER
jgi:hypothetical protein